MHVAHLEVLYERNSYLELFVCRLDGEETHCARPFFNTFFELHRSIDVAAMWSQQGSTATDDLPTIIGFLVTIISLSVNYIYTRSTTSVVPMRALPTIGV